MTLLRHLGLVLVVLGVSGCPPEGGGGPAINPKRCVVDLQATGLFGWEGTGAAARAVAGPGDLVGGQTAQGLVGDVVLENDKVRVIIDKPGRTVGPTLYGGGIIDADVKRGAGEAGRDQFGRMEVFYSLGRVTKVTDVEILSDGSAGGPAVVAASGDDVPHDLLNLKSLIASQIAGVNFVIDPDVPVNVRATTYYVLSPGESRVRMLTAFCNDGDRPATLPLVELVDFRGAMETFIPGGCANGLSSGDCLVDTSRWIAAQGDGVAYGLRSMSYADPKVPVTANATLGYGGVVGSFIEGQDMNGLLSWTDAEARSRPGTFSVRQGEQRSYLRDFVIARDVAGISSTFLKLDGAVTGTVNVTAKFADGSPAPGARVAVVTRDLNWVTEHMKTLVVADATGAGTVSLPAGRYFLTAALQGHPIGPETEVTVTGGTVDATVNLAEARTLTVNVADVAGGPAPAKVTVRCATTTCPFDEKTWLRHFVLEKVPGGAAAVAFVPVSGQLTLKLPPFEYTVQVSRGPEYSLWPDTYPAGEPVDLRTADQAVSATIGRVVDSAGWMSGDFHVHAINSTDSLVPNEVRVASFLAEGVDVLISTDHEFITDYAPVIRDLGAEQQMASMIGEEVTTFSHGHFNSVNLTRDETLANGGAFDHAGGDGPTLRLTELFPGIKAKFPGAFVQINHGRGGGGAMTQLKVDTATLASHADPADFRMAAAADATPSDTRLFGDGFDGLEVANGSNLEFDLANDWMTFLSRGTVRTATGVSDTHKAIQSVGGYARTWVRSGQSTPAEFTPSVFAEAARANKASIGNGPFVTVTARKLDAMGQPVGTAAQVGDTLSVTAGDSVEVVVDVQAPDWVQFDRVELYSHAPGREAVNGESNNEWPDSRILEIAQVDPMALPVEAVPGPGNLRRLHLTQRFVATPTADTWYAVMVRGVSSTRTLAPLTGSRPWALSNAILIDADGSGAYDDFPLKVTKSRLVPAPAVLPRGNRVATRADLEKLLLDGLHLRPEH